jgi:recombination protein RecA
MSPEMKNTLDTTLSALEKRFGKGIVMKLTEEVDPDLENVVSSGSIALDGALGIAGYRKGRLVEVFGPESSGKTTLTLHAIANAQKQGWICAFIDAEHALDPLYASNLGVDLDELLVSQPNNGEEALEVTDMLARSGEVGLIVIDSVAALTPQKEIEGEMGDSLPGLQARLMSQAMRKLTGAVHTSGCIIIFVNQIRMKIGVLYGSPETVSGGNALKFYASQRLDIRRIGAVKEKNDITGNRTRVKVVKNKLAPPFKVAEFDIKFGIGIDQVAEVLDLGVEDGIIKRAGAWYSIDGTRLGQGRENTLQLLRDDEDLVTSIRKQLLENRGLDAG